MKTLYIPIMDDWGNPETWETIKGTSLKNIFSELNGRLHEKLWSISAYSDPSLWDNPVMFCSRIQGKSYIRNKNGKEIYNS